MFSEKSLPVRLYKRQISDLVVLFNDSIWKKEDVRICQIYVGILSWYSNLQYLSLNDFVHNRFRRRMPRGLSPDRCSSSIVTDLRIKIHNFDDYLCLIDGRLSQLYTLIVILDFVCDDSIINTNFKLTSAFVRRTLIVIFDYLTDELGRCHIYSLLFTMARIHHITSSFSGGNFVNVRILRIFDFDRSFEHAFFVKISRSFPMLGQLTVSTTIQRIENPLWAITKPNKSLIIQYPHLTELNLHSVHIDYVEQCLSNLNTYLPSLNKFYLIYQNLVTVTNNFTRNQTCINCSKLKTIIFDETIHLAHSKDFYRYFPLLQRPFFGIIQFALYIE